MTNQLIIDVTINQFIPGPQKKTKGMKFMAPCKLSGPVTSCFGHWHIKFGRLLAYLGVTRMAKYCAFNLVCCAMYSRGRCALIENSKATPPKVIILCLNQLINLFWFITFIFICPKIEILYLILLTVKISLLYCDIFFTL